jgi:hypothetical protein
MFKRRGNLAKKIKNQKKPKKQQIIHPILLFAVPKP